MVKSGRKRNAVLASCTVGVPRTLSAQGGAQGERVSGLPRMASTARASAWRHANLAGAKEVAGTVSNDAFTHQPRRQ